MHGCVIVFGLGFTGSSIARMLASTGMEVHGTARTRESAEALIAEYGGWLSGVHVVDGAGDGDASPGTATMPKIAMSEALKRALSRATHVLSTAQTLKPVGGRGDAPGDVSRLHDDPVLPILDQAQRDGLLKHVRWAGYLSTTGVYGDRGGEWADESDAPKPTSARAKRRITAEAAWLRSGLPVHIFRLPGIYGPGRGPLAKVRAGKARVVLKAKQYFSRVHAADVAGAVLASVLRPTSDPSRPWCGDSAIFNVADDQPGPQGPVTREACRLLRVPAPARIPFEEASKGMSVMAKSFFQESRRVSARRLRDLLGWRPAFAGFVEGLAASLGEEQELERGLGSSVVVGASPVGPVTVSPTTAFAMNHHLDLHGLRHASEGDFRSWLAPRRSFFPVSGTSSTSMASLDSLATLIGPRPWSSAVWWDDEDDISTTASCAVEELPDASLVGALNAAGVVCAKSLSSIGRACGLPFPVPIRGPHSTTVWLNHSVSTIPAATRAPPGSKHGSGTSKTDDILGTDSAVVAAAKGTTKRPWTASKPIILVVDNGSLRAGATIALRRVCGALNQRFGIQAIPASARFSNRVDPAQLGNSPADTVATALERVWRLCPGRRVVVLPLFFGPSRTVSAFLPAAIRTALGRAVAEPPRVIPGQVRIAPWLCLAKLATSETKTGIEADMNPVDSTVHVSVRSASSVTGQAGLVAEALAAGVVAAELGDDDGVGLVTSITAEAAAISGGPSDSLHRMQSSGVSALATALADRVMEALAADDAPAPAEAEDVPVRVLLCEHGSPSRDVHAVRPVLAAALHRTLQARGVSLAGESREGDIELLPVTGCAMERREGDEHAFSEPMLEHALPAAIANAGGDHGSAPQVRVIVSLMFLLPGKHAGAGGDVAEIATDALRITLDGIDARGSDPHRAALRERGVLITDVIGEHPAVLDLLWRRLRWTLAV